MTTEYPADIGVKPRWDMNNPADAQNFMREMTENRKQGEQQRAAAREAELIEDAENKEKEKARILQQHKSELDREQEPIIEEYQESFEDLEADNRDALSSINSFFDQHIISKITEDHPIMQFAVRISDRGILNQYHCQLHEIPNERGYVPTELNRLIDHLLSLPQEHRDFAISNCEKYYQQEYDNISKDQNTELDVIANKLVTIVKRKEWLSSLSPEQRRELTQEKRQKEEAKKKVEVDRFNREEQEKRDHQGVSKSNG
ncbi:MAG TPA: hypothetical protein VI033_03590 [Candidatus Nitrosopolaris sp.]